MTYEGIMEWFKNCDSRIIISQDNKSSKVEVSAIKNNDLYKVSGESIQEVLVSLKSMLEGNYRKQNLEVNDL